MGPLVPSDTFRRYHPEAGRCAATAATVSGAWSGPTTTRFERTSPLYLYVLSVVRGAWSQPWVSAGIATKAVRPTHASTASRKSGLFPYRQSATRYLNGKSPARAFACNMAAANGGLVCKVASAGTLPLARLSLELSVNHCSGMKSRLSTNA